MPDCDQKALPQDTSSLLPSTHKTTRRIADSGPSGPGVDGTMLYVVSRPEKTSEAQFEPVLICEGLPGQNNSLYF